MQYFILFINNDVNVKFSAHETRFWNNLHLSKKFGEPNNLRIFGRKETEGWKQYMTDRDRNLLSFNIQVN